MDGGSAIAAVDLRTRVKKLAGGTSFASAPCALPNHFARGSVADRGQPGGCRRRNSLFVRHPGQLAVNRVVDFSGLTDLPERSAQDCARCRCGSLARVASGLCVSCLLRNGLGSDEPNIEDFDALLAAVDVPDRDWQLGSYRILEEIGRGGMGVIYRARHAPSRRIGALKRVLNYHSDSRETLTRFQREARAAASLDHPNILPIYDVGASDDGLPFFSMKFAAGGSLSASRPTVRHS